MRTEREPRDTTGPSHAERADDASTEGWIVIAGPDYHDQT